VDLITTKQNKLPSFIDRLSQEGSHVPTRVGWVNLFNPDIPRDISQSKCIPYPAGKYPEP
jgi:hypothetical protein